MHSREGGRRRARAVLVLLAVFLGAAATGGAEQRSGAPSEGIKVHGHWTLEIRNPDGSLASRHEIENELLPGMGKPLLDGLIGTHYVDTLWGINLWGSPADPCGPQPTNGPCAIGSNDLTVTVPMVPGSPTTPVGTLELAAAVTIARDSRLYNVNAIWSAVIRGTTTRVGNQFSGKTIDIQVRQGQIVQLKVVYSFS